MTFADFLIVYLAFGAPLAVYKYLQNRTDDIRQRILVSGFTFFFWIPAAVQIGYLHLTNAYFTDDFVSQQDSDATSFRSGEMRESLSAGLIRLTRGSNVHDLRETVERYTGLAEAVQIGLRGNTGPGALFEIAGREEYDLGRVCLTRRNLRRLQRHHMQARQDFLALFRKLTNRAAASAVIGMGVDLARQLEDHETVELLNELTAKKGEVWKPTQQEQPQTIVPTSIQPLAMTTVSLNNE